MRRTASIIAALILASTLVLAAVGCGGGLPKDEPGISGKVTEMDLADNGKEVMITVAGSGSAGNKAIATLTEESLVYGPNGEEARGVDMNKGTQVKVWFDGKPSGAPAKGKALAVQITK